MGTDANLAKLNQIKDILQKRLKDAGSDVVLRCEKAIADTHYVLSFSLANEGASNPYEAQNSFDPSLVSVVMRSLQSSFKLCIWKIEGSENAIGILGGDLDELKLKKEPTIRLRQKDFAKAISEGVRGREWFRSGWIAAHGF